MENEQVSDGGLGTGTDCGHRDAAHRREKEAARLAFEEAEAAAKAARPEDKMLRGPKAEKSTEG